MAAAISEPQCGAPSKQANKTRESIFLKSRSNKMFISKGSQLFIDIIGEVLLSDFKKALRMDSVSENQNLHSLCVSLILK